MTKIITAKTYEEFRNLCPYGKWTCDDGAEVLFNRSYWPILARASSDEPAYAANPNDWIRWRLQDHLFDDWSSPWRDVQSGRRIGTQAQKTMTLINSVLTLWDLPSLASPPKRRMPERERVELHFLDMTQPVPPRVNPWKALLEIEHV